MSAEHRLTFHVYSDSPEGVVKVTRARWSEILYRFSRAALKEAGEVEELQGSGIYFLLGVKDGCRTIYIGQAQNIYRRLMQHSLTESKGFWTHTLALTSTGDAVFNAAHLNYLENRFHELATESGALSIENSMPPSVGCGITTIQQEMDECISHTATVLNLMGYHFLEKRAVLSLPEPPSRGDEASGAVAEPASVAAPGAETKPTKTRAPKYNFYQMGFKDGDELVYEDREPAHRTVATVCGEHLIMVNGVAMTPHALAKSFRGTDNVYAFAYISRNGEKLSTIYNRIYKNYPPAKEAPPADLRYFTMADADAVGRPTEDGGMVVLSGSRLCAETKKSCPAAAARLRCQVGKDHITDRDYAFSSWSAAAHFVGGCMLNGRICWTETRREPKRRRRKKA